MEEIFVLPLKIKEITALELPPAMGTTPPVATKAVKKEKSLDVPLKRNVPPIVATTLQEDEEVYVPSHH